VAVTNLRVTNLRVIRQLRGLSQEDVAKKLGYSIAVYGPVERGIMIPSARLRGALEDLFGFSADVLLAEVQAPAPARAEAGTGEPGPRVLAMTS
jgi:transcriptional regulator with XRE-family HTH domain